MEQNIGSEINPYIYGYVFPTWLKCVLQLPPL